MREGGRTYQVSVVRMGDRALQLLGVRVSGRAHELPSVRLGGTIYWAILVQILHYFTYTIWHLYWL